MSAALAAAQAAAEFVRTAPRPNARDWDRKSRSDFVTEIDREAERRIAASLLAAVPGSRVIGEESAGPGGGPDDPGDGVVTWVVDPLDGTTNYLHDYPMYSISVAAVVNRTPVAAAVVDIVRGLHYRAAAGSGAWCGTRRLRVSSITDPTMALVGTGFPFKAPANLRFDEYLAQFRRILPQTSGIRRCGSAALDLAHVAEGRLDGFWEIGLASWDVAAGMLLVREAGGVVTDFSGRPAPVAHGDFVAGNGAVHGWLLRQLRDGGIAG
jgi:myo-inositol-1(or 4)-monophosphatase